MAPKVGHPVPLRYPSVSMVELPPSSPAPSVPAGAANRLDRETSLYLRQHRDNPVDWWAWGEAPFAQARAEDKPVLVSIGYSACHWCHVMAHESFEDPETAALMNRLFVNVKVDREERPDVDQVYMDTVVRLTGHGGWPLTVFCTPEGRPFYGGTYYPPEPRHGMPAFRQVLEAVEQAWRARRDEVETSARRILSALDDRPHGVASELPGAAGLRRAAEQLLANADPKHGGFGGAPKFPTPTSLDLLLAAADVLPPERGREAVAHAAFTCREMSRGGVYDQLAGGFHRYSVDAEWLVPHFEKMLYDQGQLLATCAEAWRRTGDPELEWPIRETADYLKRELSAPDGGLYASSDADSEGEEGIYFVWTPEQVEAELGPERAPAFCRAYDVSPRGNFEHGRSVLRDLAREPRERFAEERAALLRARSGRVAPALDTKRITAWNALCASGLARAASALEDDALLADAVRITDFVWERLRPGGRLARIFAEGEARGSAFLDDAAALLAALLDLYRAGAGDRHLGMALEVAEDIAARFFDRERADLFLAPEDGERLVHRPRSDHDGATPHSAGLAVMGLVRAADLSGRGGLREVADAVLRSHAFAVEKVPPAYPTLLRAACLAERGSAVAVVVGDAGSADLRALATRARRLLAPDDAVVVAAGPEATPAGLDPSWLAGRAAVDGRATAYLCRGTTCSPPVTEPERLAEAVEEGRP